MRYNIEKGFYDRVVKLIKSIPAGQVATYGQIADYAGNPRAAREVAYILHSSSEKEDLPWQRVINSKGSISMKPGHGYELQKRLLEDEGVLFNEEDRVDFQQFLWQP
jgi:methylated-DNA-protein-cysteine methyltransferase-like protein